MDIFINQIGIEETSERNEKNFLPVWEENKKAVFEDLGTNFLHSSEKGRAALAVAKTLSDSWWQKRENEEPYRLVQELYHYADERAAREARQQVERLERQAGVHTVPAPTQGEAVTALPPKKGHRPSRFGVAPRRAPQPAPQPAPEKEGVSVPVIEEKPLPPIVLSVEADEAEMVVLQQTQKYFFHPETRPPRLFKETPLKVNSELSKKSIEDYTRLEKQVKKELRAKGLSTGWDLALYLAQTAREYSVSTYKKKRVVVMRMMEKVSPAAVGLIKALPPYVELCTMLGRTPSRRSTPITEARRAQQNKKIFDRLLGQLSPEHRDAILCLRLTGARCSEGRSLRLEQVPDGIRVTIQSAKTGARKKQGSATRSWLAPLGTEEGDALEGILDRRGEAPIPYSGHALRSAWHRTRKRFGLNQDPHWDLHSLRHQYAGELKKQRVAELKAAHGEDWRRHLYGRNWMSSPQYVKEFYGPVAERLGHSCLAMAKIYG